MHDKVLLNKMIDEKQSVFTNLSDQIWNFAETRFALSQSASVFCDAMEKEGFRVTRGLAGMDDAFIAEYGSGSPVIGILAEYDALASLSQKCDVAEEIPLVEGGNGHGCGHHLLGGGAAAGAVGIKDYMEKNNMTGTIKLFGCPAEESGYGKAFMARDGVFDGTDALLTWHPMDSNGVWDYSSLAVYQTYFHFKGKAAHAAAAPEHGRSALDAAELMNIGVSFLREHIIDEGRIHYAFMDVGGVSANVVQPTATLYYFVRAPKPDQAKHIYDRVVKIAHGAAMMTETDLEIEFDSAAVDYLANKQLAHTMYDNLLELGPIEYTQEEKAYAQKFFDTLPEFNKSQLKNKIRKIFPNEDEAVIQKEAESPLSSLVPPMTFPSKAMSGSTDVGDASWVSPTATVSTVSFVQGTPPHSWQWVATGKSSMAHKGMIAAGKVIAMTALDLLTKPEILEKAKEEHAQSLGGKKYESLIPPEVSPR